MQTPSLADNDKVYAEVLNTASNHPRVNQFENKNASYFMHHYSSKLKIPK